MNYKDIINNRVDYNTAFTFFNENDFEGLNAINSNFKSHQKNIYGRFYYYNYTKYEAIVILSHGFGGGHLAYTQEINVLAKNGFIVYAYDNYGTSKSDGKSIRSLYESIYNLNDAINHVESIKNLKKYKINLIGHSMGGYSVGCVLKFHPEINCSVILAGPNDFFESFCKLNNLDDKKIQAARLIEKNLNGKYTNLKLGDVLQNVESNVYMLYGEKDPIIPRGNYEYLKNKLISKPNIKIELIKGKMHNPNYSDSAIQYAIEKNIFLVGKQKESLSDVDFKKVSEQDPYIWKDILKMIKE